MIPIANGRFYPERLVFVPSSLGDDRLGDVFARYPVLDDDAENRKTLFAHHPHHTPVRPELLTKLGFSLSRNCNLRCQYCSACSSEGYGTAVSQEDVLALVSDVMKRWTIAHLLSPSESGRLELYFTGGGEPTYDWEAFCGLILAIEDKARRNEIPLQLGITTNGVLDDAKADFLAKHFQRIMVSYDGCPDIQNRNRKSPHYSETSPLVERCLQRLCAKSSPLTVRTTVWPDDFHRLREMADFLFGTLGCRFTWSILPVSPMGRAATKCADYEADADNAAYDFLKAYLDICQYAGERWGDAKVETQFFPISPAHLFCGSLAYAAQCAWLMSNGDIVTCVEADQFPTVLGHVKDGAVEYHSECEDLLLEKAQQLFDSCKWCFAYPFCKGGCPAKAIARERARITEGMPWDCRMTVKFWKYLLTGVLEGKEVWGWRAEPSKFEELRDAGVLEFVRPSERNEDLLK